MQNKGQVCSIETCLNPARTRGLCGTHYSRVHRGGLPVDAPLENFKDVPGPVRLLRIVDIHGPNDCWEVRPRSRNTDGYGRVTVDGKRVYAHRLSYEIFVGPIPESQVVCHHCDNPPCVNPAHLFTGTMLDNSQDMLAKGRESAPPVRWGEANNKCKLTDKQVAEIRQRWTAGERNKTRLAAEYGVHRSRIYQLVNRPADRGAADRVASPEHLSVVSP